MCVYKFINYIHVQKHQTETEDYKMEIQVLLFSFYIRGVSVGMSVPHVWRSLP